MEKVHDNMTESEKKLYKERLLMEMPHHFGKSRAIGMGELYQLIFGEAWAHRINDTRRLRKLITELRREDGLPICSLPANSGGGYYYASAGSELAEFCETLRRRALKILAMEAKIRKISLAELVGQLRLDLEVME
jgi:hypothetical protein